MINSLFVFIFMFLLWCALVFPVTLEKNIVGIIVSFTISAGLYIFVKDKKVFNIGRILNFIWFVLIFTYELIKANFIMAKLVLTPSLPISPKIIKVKTTIKSNTGRAFLANAITLTPGTLSVDLKEDDIFIHIVEGIKVSNGEDIIKPFEKVIKGAFDN
ncbi:MAG: Na+/H+ antiporter subunit E [Clostridiaceae bacterium]